MGLALAVICIVVTVASVTFATECRSAPVPILTVTLPGFKEVICLRFFVDPFGLGLWLPLSGFLLGKPWRYVCTLLGGAFYLTGCRYIDGLEFSLKGNDIIFLFVQNVPDSLLLLILEAIFRCLHSLFWRCVISVLIVLLFFQHVCHKGLIRAFCITLEQVSHQAVQYFPSGL